MIYFGQCDSAGNPLTNGEDQLNNGVCWWNTFTAPASLRRIAELSAYCRLFSGTGSFRLAVYDSTGTTLIGQTGIVTMAVGGIAWNGDSTVGITITPGTSYIIAICVKASGTTNFRMETDSTGPSHRSGTGGGFTYVDGGFPASLPASSSAANAITVRAGGPTGLLLRRRRRLAA